MKIARLLTSMTAIFLLMTASLNGQVQPISLNAINPHYFTYQGKPVILITSGEHYGALLNLDFDFKTYFAELHANGLNLTRTFSGAYIEPPGAFNIAGNTLAPAANRFICPWARSNEGGYSNGGNKFDLRKWDTAYFERLKKVVAAARDKGVIVEFSLFCPFYEEGQWQLSPMNFFNNVNGVGNVGRNDVYTLDKNDGLLAVQDSMVKKIVCELRNFDNVIYEICNEPYFGGVTLEWQHHIADVITETEKGFTGKHLISQNIANGSALVAHPYPPISVYNYHYASPPIAVAQNYHLNKVIGDNETGFRGTSDSTYRREGWQFILAGGGLYNNLDYSFTVGKENGTFNYPSTQPGGGSSALRKQLGLLSTFMKATDFIRMIPDTTTLMRIMPATATCTMLSEAGKQYAIYITGKTSVLLELNLPTGNYQLEWMNTRTGQQENKVLLHHTGGIAKIQSPVFSDDIALSIRRSSE